MVRSLLPPDPRARVEEVAKVLCDWESKEVPHGDRLPTQSQALSALARFYDIKPGSARRYLVEAIEAGAVFEARTEPGDGRFVFPLMEGEPELPALWAPDGSIVQRLSTAPVRRKSEGHAPRQLRVKVFCMSPALRIAYLALLRGRLQGDAHRAHADQVERKRALYEHRQSAMRARREALRQADPELVALLEEMERRLQHSTWLGTVDSDSGPRAAFSIAAEDVEDFKTLLRYALYRSARL